MYKITFKDKTKSPVNLGDEDGLKVKAIFGDNTISRDKIISLKNPDISFPKNEIKFIDKIADQKLDTNTQDTLVEDKKLYHSWKIKSPQEKAERPDILFFFRYAIEEWNPEKESHLIKDLKEFFEKNPKRTYGDGEIYLKYFKKNKVKEGYALGMATTIIARVINNDMYNARS